MMSDPPRLANPADHSPEKHEFQSLIAQWKDDPFKRHLGNDDVIMTPPLPVPPPAGANAMTLARTNHMPISIS